MLGILNRIGIVCYRFCYILGTILAVLGFWLSIISNGPAVYIIWYFFAVVLFITGFLVKYIFCGMTNDLN